MWCPAVIVELPFLLHPKPLKRGDVAKGKICTRQRRDKGKHTFSGGPGPPSSRSSSLSLPSSPSRDAKLVMLPTLVSRRKVRTAGVSHRPERVFQRKELAGASTHMPSRRALLWESQVLHLTKRWWRDCLSPPPRRQHSLDRIFFIFVGLVGRSW